MILFKPSYDFFQYINGIHNKLGMVQLKFLNGYYYQLNRIRESLPLKLSIRSAYNVIK